MESSKEVGLPRNGMGLPGKGVGVGLHEKGIGLPGKGVGWDYL